MESASPGMSLFPLAAALTAGAFGAVLGARFAAGRRPHEGLWAIAMLMYSAASFAMFLGVARGWTVPAFRTYWLLGAILNVPYLALGELFLLTRNRRLAAAGLILVLVATGYAGWIVWDAPLVAASLRFHSLPLGREVFGDGTLPYRLSQLYAFPAYFFLLGGSVLSAWRMRARPDLRERAGGVALIALGATVVAIGSGIGAGFRLAPVFSASLALGVGIMFGGFLVATRRVSSRLRGGERSRTSGTTSA